MTAPPPRKTLLRRLLTPIGMAVVLVILCGGMVAGMAAFLVREIEAFSTANSDNLQWSLAQADVEFLRFRLAVEQARQDEVTLDEVRRRFDIFYSRFGTFEQSAAFRNLPAPAEKASARDAVRAFLENSIPLIDAANPALREALPELENAAEAVSDDLRQFSLAGLNAFARASDARRETVEQALIALAVLLAAILAGLILISATLYRINRQDKARAREARRTGERMQAIVDTALDAILVTDATGAIREFNPAAQRIFGYARDEVLGRNATDLLFPPEVAEELRRGSLGFVDTPEGPKLQDRHIERQAMNRDGRRFPAEISVVRAEAGNLFVAYIRDISRRRAAEEGLTEARDRALAGERAKSEFLAVMSHEMRTPLNGLLGTMQLMRDHSLSERQSALLDRMQSSGRLLLGLVNDVLDLAKYEAGRIEIDRRPFSVTRMLDGVIETAAPLAAEARTTLDWQWVGPERDAAAGDLRRLRQVMLNLVGNAIKFTRRGRVDLEVEWLGGGATLEFRVIDTGIGIAEADLDRIFEDFETLDSSYARQAGGTGLGLGIARRLTEAMGGEIGVESELGEGSLFWVRVPLGAADMAGAAGEVPAPAVAGSPGQVPTPAAPTTATAEGAGASTTLRALDLLLVEDNEVNRFVAREMLEAEGHRVTEAFDGRAGVEWAEARGFDAILMDVSMPVMDGPTATRRIREGGGASAKAPIIAVTAHALPEEVARFHEAGMVACISKPLDRQELRQVLADVLARGKAPTPVADALPEAPGPALLDEAQISTLRAGLPAEARDRLHRLFLDEMDEEIARLAALAPGDAEVQALAHKCAGNCATFGLVALRLELGRIETAAKRGSPAGADRLAALPALWTESRAALERFIAAG